MELHSDGCNLFFKNTHHNATIFTCMKNFNISEVQFEHTVGGIIDRECSVTLKPIISCKAEDNFETNNADDFYAEMSKDKSKQELLKMLYFKD